MKAQTQTARRTALFRTPVDSHLEIDAVHCPMVSVALDDASHHDGRFHARHATPVNTEALLGAG
jgi:hypothetical protein